MASSLNRHSFDKRCFEIDCSDLEVCLKNREFERVLSDTYLFWKAFCKVFMEMSLSKHYFSVRKMGNSVLRIKGKEGNIKEISETVGKLWKFFRERNCTFVAIRIYDSYNGLSSYYFEKKKERISLLNVSDSQLISGSLFDQCLLPVLPKLANTLGLSMKKTERQQVVIPSVAPILFGLYKTAMPPEETVLCDEYQLGSAE